jgi:hypothetical protein
MNLRRTSRSPASPTRGGGTTDVTSSVLDMNGFDGVMYIALLGDVTSNSVLTLTAKENTANSTSSPTPTITGAATAAYTATATDADNKALMVDVCRPLKQYQFLVLSRATPTRSSTASSRSSTAPTSSPPSRTRPSSPRRSPSARNPADSGNVRRGGSRRPDALFSQSTSPTGT